MSVADGKLAPFPAMKRVTEARLLERLNRRIGCGSLEVKRTEAADVDEFGKYYLLDTVTGKLTDDHVDIVVWANYLGLIDANEEALT